MQRLAERDVSAVAMELVPRITRAQKMDALSSRPALPATRPCCSRPSSCRKYFPMLMTAAGTSRPARVVVLGAGVAGLQAIATARRLGAVGRSLRRAAGGQGTGRVARRASSSSAAGGRRAPKARAAMRKRGSEDFYRRQREIVGERLAASRRGDHHRARSRQARAARWSPRRWSRAWRPAR